MTFIFNLDTEDFLALLNKTFENDNKKFKDKQEELLLHRWGYELMVTTPISFEEYRMKALGVNKVDSVNKKYNKLNNDELAREIEMIKQMDQS